jgi:hypothetical protein
VEVDVEVEVDVDVDVDKVVVSGVVFIEVVVVAARFRKVTFISNIRSVLRV